MKIKNEEVTIQIGRKKAKFRNTILDQYLKKFIDCQLATNQGFLSLVNTRELRYILLKFDTPLQFDTDSIITNDQFDIAIIFNSFQKNTVYKDNKIIVDYTYNQSNELYSIYDYEAGGSTGRNTDFSEYKGRKVTAIGFNTSWMPREQFPVCSIINTSNYNIYLDPNQQLSFTRRDTIESDLIFFTNSNLDGAIHLTPERYLQGKLVAIGFSNSRDFIDDIHYIEDMEIERDNFSISFPKLPNVIGNSLVASDNIAASNSLVCGKETFKYLVLQYMVFEIHMVDGEYQIQYKGDYFMSNELEKYGNTKITLKYERG